MTRIGIVVALAAVMLMSACGDATEDADVQATGAPATAATTPQITTPSATSPFVTSPLTIVADTEEVTVPSSPDIDPALQGLVDQATADLATRLSVDPSTITTVSAKSVTWPDGSLGCPQPGMNYIQVTVDGVLIELSAGGTTYSYHSGGSRAPFLCQKT